MGPFAAVGWVVDRGTVGEGAGGGGQESMILERVHKTVKTGSFYHFEKHTLIRVTFSDWFIIPYS